MSTSSTRLPQDRSSIPTAASMTDLVEALYVILDVVDPVAFAPPASPDPSFHGLSGELWDYKNSPQLKVVQSSSISPPLFPKV